MANLPKLVATTLPTAVSQFDAFPDSALISITTHCTITDSSRAKAYRMNRAGLLPFVKVGNSTRIKVGVTRAILNGSTGNIVAPIVKGKRRATTKNVVA